ncbi:MAG: dienelactone hydrolase family protein [Gemmataceae bacterium]|nr:dienelactone hydrolase family protein [Gemmataceae bacterium]
MPLNSELLIDGPDDARWTVVLAHGAGAAMDAPFINHFAVGLAERDFRAVRFEFPYMANYRKTGQRKPPDREPVLRKTWLDVVAELSPDGLVIGGKSMGGRIASLIADEAGVAGLICLGYPFHPVGKPDRLRVQHLRDIKTPTLIVQGERDPFGSREEVAEYKLSSTIQVEWTKDGDHSFKPRKRSGTTEPENLGTALQRIVQFLEDLSTGRTSKRRN